MSHARGPGQPVILMAAGGNRRIEMGLKPLILLGASLLCAAAGPAIARAPSSPYMQLAELEIDPAQLDAYNTAIKEHIEAALRAEPGVLSLYAVAHSDNPARITVFEIYQDKDAY